MSHGADVISCSWGPQDGDWFTPGDPLHNHVEPLPPSTKLAIDHAVANGRNGKGCVILFAAGNGNESVDNDGYASYSKVTAVAACNDRGKKSVYSDFGAGVWCAFPSNDFGFEPFDQPEPLSRGIWTVDRTGNKGYNSGSNGDGDAAGNFTSTFGGTSSACPGAAGVAALVLAVNPNLKWNEVKDILKRSCDRIDPASGAYNSAGHSAKYGFGRLNALRAVQLAQPQAQNVLNVQRTFDLPIPDLQTVSFTLDVTDATPVEALAVTVDLKHTFIGDLIIELKAPATTGVGRVTLHNRAGGSAHDLKKTYDAATTPGLGSFAGKSCKGTWTLTIRDAAAADSGTLECFALVLRFPHQDRVAPAPKAAKKARKKVAKKRRTVLKNASRR